ncbi:hypothetical protein FRX31_032420 [Thalictrum thalictroides]|uniref:Uncharacterized protein n=1 Tax=Thalictrum thalictroides TaxID=46969 RepID=A0A7J6UZ91_THATH|nr:hypothetical protein FRX31_032420 [Thalictrum thalictroides]
MELKGWRNVGVELKKITEPLSSPKGVARQVPGGVSKSISFADICRGGKPRQNGGLPVVDVRCDRMGMLNSWWNPVVICKTNCSEPDWEWVEGKVLEVFPQAIVKFVKKNEAVIAMHSEEEALKLVGMPPLVNWEGSFHFHQWNQEAGSLTEDDIRSLFKEVKINFHGIPYHLREKSTVEDLAQQCGRRWVIDENSIRYDKDQCSITLMSPEFDKIPRIIILSMQGKKTPVVVEVVGGFPIALTNHVIDGLKNKRVPHLSSPISHHRPTVYRENSNFVAENILPTTTGSAPPSFDQEFRYDEVDVAFDLQENRVVREEGQNFESYNPFEALEMQDNMSAHTPETGECSIQAHLPLNPFHEAQSTEKGKAVLSEFEPIQPIDKSKRRNRQVYKPQNQCGNLFWSRRLWAHNGLRGRSSSRGRRQRRGIVRSRSRTGRDNEGRVGVIELSSSQNQDFSATSVIQRPMEESMIREGEQRESRREIVESLLRCEQNKDAAMLIKWVVIPLAKTLGVTSSLGSEGLFRLFSDLNRSESFASTEEEENHGGQELQGENQVNHVD